MNFDQKIEELFIDLPEPPSETGAVVNAVQTGKLVFLSGVLPWKDGRLLNKGRVGLELNLDAGKAAASAACIQALGILKSFLGGSLNSIKKIVSFKGYVASGAEFRDQHKVLDGASQLILDVFGSISGRHSRVAVGVASLPSGAPVEIEIVVEVK